MTDALNFKCAVVTGGAGGIGRALAEYLISKDKKVLLVGRTESKLQQTSKEIGAAGYYVLDTGNIADIPSFVGRITKEHPEVDCLINNAGVQRPLNVNETTDFLEKADEEININIRGPMHLALKLLPHLQSKPSAMIINVTSLLGYSPFMVMNPVYCGTKAWLHCWSMNLRSQLANSGSKVRVVELVPPTVETDLHRERDNPDDNKKTSNPNAMSVKEFIDEVSVKLERGDDTVAAGMANEAVDKWYAAYGEQYAQATKG